MIVFMYVYLVMFRFCLVNEMLQFTLFNFIKIKELTCLEGLKEAAKM